MSRGVNRRGFLKYMGVTGAFAIFEKSKAYEARRLVPYLVPPEEITPGIATWYATVCRECPAGCGMHVKCREGRAIKAEGNPNHPVNMGALCARGQASLQGHYNPDRLKEPLLKEAGGKFRPISWEDGEKALLEKLESIRSGQQKGRVVVVTPFMTGSLHKLVQDWLGTMGEGEHLMYEPFAYEALRGADRLTFGRNEIPQYRVDKAEMLISLGAEFLDSWGSPVEQSRHFGEMHRFREDGVRQFISIEPRLSIAAANADEWVSVKPGAEAAAAMCIVHLILEEGLGAPLSSEEIALLKELSKDFTPEKVEAVSGIHRTVFVRLARAFAKARPGLALGSSVTAGGKAGMDSAVAANLLNYVCGNVGETVLFGMDTALSRLPEYGRFLELVRSMQRGEVGLLLLNNVNPAYNVPPAAGFKEAMEKVPFKVALSTFQDETAAMADMTLPVTTSFEEWGDHSPRKGVMGLMQPAMRPIFETRSLGDILLSLSRSMGEKTAAKFPWENYRSFLMEYWRGLGKEYGGGKDFSAFWEDALRQGGVWREAKGEKASLSRGISQYRMETQGGKGERGGSSYQMVTYPGNLFDGRGANKPWLQELPDSLHKLVWDSWVELNPETAWEKKIREGDIVSIETSHGRIEAPALLYEGMPAGLIAVPLGQGHTDFGRYANGVGANPLSLLAGAADEVTGGPRLAADGVILAKTGKRHKFATTRGSKSQLGREIVQVMKGAAFRISREVKKPEPLRLPGRIGFYKLHPHPEHRWGMVIDLQKCTGCGACVVGCYAENNVAIVGKKEVGKGREMAWISIQSYLEEVEGSSRVYFIPMLCQQCTAAPCETVCPTYAAYHTPEGLNAQIYNRCVGTRYCSNNCPYKVRRFNWFGWQWPEPLNWQLNPDVTVRSKGVMEKCNFCVQRIVEGKNRAKDEGRQLRDGEILPACAQTCPTRAITFGDLKDEKSAVSRLTKDERGYHVLEELNTMPAITYLKKVL